MGGVTHPPGMVFSQDWFSYNIPHLTEILAEFSGRNGVAFLEIGSFEGRSTVWFLQQILTGEGSTITCVDTFLGGRDHAALDIDHNRLLVAFRSNVAAFGDRVRVREGKSAVVLRGMAAEETYDVVYVDGSHEMVDVLADAVLAWPLLKTGGVMIFDDYRLRLPGVRPGPAIDAFLAVYADRHEVLFKAGQLAVRKVGVKPGSRHARLRRTRLALWAAGARLLRPFPRLKYHVYRLVRRLHP